MSVYKLDLRSQLQPYEDRKSPVKEKNHKGPSG